MAVHLARAVFAVVVWLAASVLFALYTSRFASYNKTRGSLSTVIVMLTWLLALRARAAPLGSREQRGGGARPRAPTGRAGQSAPPRLDPDNAGLIERGGRARVRQPPGTNLWIQGRGAFACAIVCAT